VLEARRLARRDAHDFDPRRDRVEWEVVAVARQEPDREPEAVRGDRGVEDGAARPGHLAEAVERDVADDDEVRRGQDRS